MSPQRFAVFRRARLKVGEKCVERHFQWQACLHLRARQVSGTNAAQLDFNAVQRGDAEMGQKAYRVVRACVESGAANPILSIHDQVRGHPREHA